MLRAFVSQKAGALTRHVCLTVRPPCIAPRSLPLQRYYATTPKHVRKRNRQAREAERTPAYAASLLQLRDALDVGSVPHIGQAYSGVRTLVPLGGADVAQMAQAVHTALRKLSQEVKQKRIPADLTTFADTLVHDIRARNLPPSFSAHLHLLSFYKEAAQFEKGKDFWAWLVHQDDTYVNAALYGVAMELLAVQGSPAEDTELLYLDALKRFPGYFNEYHLSPDAVVSDRAQPIDISGVSMTLLQGILTARLLSGHTSQAYLTLDTALRLYPTLVPSRFFALFIQERPVTEAYKVFGLACRAGSAPGQDALKMLLTKLRQVVASDPIDNAGLLRSMLTASYAYLASGGSVTSNHLNELIIGITALLKSRIISRMTAEQRHQVTDSMDELLRNLFAIWASRSSRPGISAFNSMIANIAGKGKRKEMIQTYLDQIEHMGLKPNVVTRRSILSAAGDIGEEDLIHEAWTDLVALRIESDTALDLADWQTLAKAGKKAKAVDYVKKQLVNFEVVVTPFIANRISNILEGESFGEAKHSVDDAPIEEIKETITLLNRDVEYMATQVQERLFRDFGTDPLPLSLEDSSPYLYKGVPEEHIRVVYDEMTIDTKSPRPAEVVEIENNTSSDGAMENTSSTNAAETRNTGAKTVPPPPAISSTGLPFDELRYQNWRTVNELLFEAEKHDSEYMAAVDLAIRTGTSPPKRDLGVKVTRRPCDVVGLSNLDAMSASQGEEQTEARSYNDFRDQIFKLRARAA